MRFQPRAEDELDSRTLLPNGEYSATVEVAADEVSKTSGNEQIHLKLKVTADDGRQNTVHDYLLDKMPAKLRHFCNSANLMTEYEAGELSADICSGLTIRVQLGIEKGKDQYADKNIVKDYVPTNVRQVPPRSAAPPATASVGTAKNAWLVIWNRFVGEFPAEASKRGEAWKKCFSGYFPGKTEAVISPGDWSRFQKDVGKWDPIKGWPVKETPFGDDTFDDDSIPF